MNKQEIKGRGKRIRGEIREEVGRLDNNKVEQLKGRIDQLNGMANEGVGTIRRKIRSINRSAVTMLDDAF